MVDYSMYSGTLATTHNHPSTAESKLKAVEIAKNYETAYRNQSDTSSGRRHASPEINRTPDLRSDPNQTEYANMRFEMMPGHNNVPYPGMMYPNYPPFDSQSSNFMDQSQFGLPNPVPFMRMEEENEARGRAENWHYAETKQFVNILLSHRHELADLRRHAGVWETVATELQAYGYDRSVDKCKNRWKVLVAKYKKYTEKSLKGRPRQPSIPPSQIKMPGFMANGHNPDIAINYHYYNTTRGSNPHSGTGGFEFYTEMHELLQHIYSHGPDGLIKRRTPLTLNNLPLSAPQPYSQPPSTQHPNFVSTHPSAPFPTMAHSLYPMNQVPNGSSYPSQMMSLPNQPVFKPPIPQQYREPAL